MNERAVKTQWVFHRHAQVELSVVYDILVPQRSARLPRAGHEQEAGPCNDDRSDLGQGLLGPAGQGRDDQLPARRGDQPRRAAGA